MCTNWLDAQKQRKYCTFSISELLIFNKERCVFTCTNIVGANVIVTIRGAGVEDGGFLLRDLLNFAKKLAGWGLVKPYTVSHITRLYCIQEAKRPHTVYISGVLCQIKGDLRKRHREEKKMFIKGNSGEESVQLRNACVHDCVNEQHSASAPAPNQAWQLKAMLVSGHYTWSNLAFGAFTSAPDKDPLYLRLEPTHRASIPTSPPLLLTHTHTHWQNVMPALSGPPSCITPPLPLPSPSQCVPAYTRWTS